MSKATTRASKKSPAKAEDSKYPSPFQKAPTSIESFLPQLDPAKIYITHIDRHKPEYKKQIFLIAVLVNSTIAFLLAWRLYVAIPKYLALVRTIFGYASSETVDVTRTTRQEQIWIVLQRAGMMVLDFLLFRFTGPWPLSFFFEQPANPVTWRWKIGFRPEEVVVRVCRNWEGQDLMQGTKRGEENPFFKTRIEPAVEGRFMEKTGYLMMDGNWDLDFGLIEDAHALVNQEKIKMEDLDRLVLAHEESSGWLAWRFPGLEVSSGDVGLELRKAMESVGDPKTE